MTYRKKGIFLLVPIVLFLIVFRYYSFRSQVANLPLQADEMVWVGRSFYIDLLFKGDLLNSLWRTEKIDADPRLTSFLYGMWIYPKYLHQASQDLTLLDYLAQQYVINSWYIPNGLEGKIIPISLSKDRKLVQWENYEDKNYSKAHLYEKYGKDIQKGINLISYARRISVLFLSASVVIFYFILLQQCKSHILAGIVSLFYGFSELIVHAGLAANTEGFLLFFFLLTVLIMQHVFSKDVSAYKWYVGLGIVMGCLNQIKLNGIVMVILFNASFIILKIAGKVTNVNFKRIMLTNSTFIIINIALNPTAYLHPFQFTHHQYQWTYEVTRDQLTRFPFSNLDSLDKKLNSINKTLFPPQYYEKFGLSSQWLYGSMYGTIISLLASLGIVLLPIRLYVSRTSPAWRIHAVTMIVTVGIIGTLLWSYMLAWPRYLVQLVPVVWFCVGYSINGIVFLIKKWYGFLYAQA